MAAQAVRRRLGHSEAVVYFDRMFAEADRNTSGNLDEQQLSSLLSSMGYAPDAADLEALLAAADTDGDGEVTSAELMAWYEIQSEEKQADVRSRVLRLAYERAKNTPKPLIRYVVGWGFFMLPAVINHQLGARAMYLWLLFFGMLHYRFKHIIRLIAGVKGQWTCDPRSWTVFTVPVTVRANVELCVSLERMFAHQNKKSKPLVRLLFGALLFSLPAAAGCLDQRLVGVLCFAFGLMHFNFPHMIRLASGLRGTWMLDPRTWDLRTIPATLETNRRLWARLLGGLWRQLTGGR